MNKENLISLFPRLTSYAKIVNPANERYNCVMHALGGKTFFIEPLELSEQPIFPTTQGIIYFWPTGFSDKPTVDNYVKLFNLFKYNLDDGDSYSIKFRKIAIFCYSGTNIFSHVALQIGPDVWSSKLGEGAVLQHHLFELEGGMYGNVYCFMRRPRTISKEFDFEVFGRYLN